MLSQKLNIILSQDVQHPLVIETQRRPGPKDIPYGIPAEEWPMVLQRVANHESYRKVAADYGVSRETIRRCELVNDLKDYFKISPAQTQAETPRKSFEAAYTRLKSAGFCLAYPEAAWASFIVLRSAYADTLHRLMNYWVVSQRKF